MKSGTGKDSRRFGLHRFALQTCWHDLPIGITEQFDFHVVKDKVHVHDLRATIRRLLGFDHMELTYYFQRSDFRQTDVEGEIVEKLVA